EEEAVKVDIPVQPSSPSPSPSYAPENPEPVEKPDPFRTQSIPVIGAGTGDNKYAELQFGQQNNNK
ncbi:MAG: hypothetical protein IKK88_04760, partial [Oscillospiraceae bacterium]|nr:hypothetical protein [Oscillospiraceae bacterium]